MNFWSPYPFVRITVAFSTGILLLQLFPLEVSNFSANVISITVIYLVLVIILKRLDLSHSVYVFFFYALMKAAWTNA